MNEKNSTINSKGLLTTKSIRLLLYLIQKQGNLKLLSFYQIPKVTYVFKLSNKRFLLLKKKPKTLTKSTASNILKTYTNGVIENIDNTIKVKNVSPLIPISIISSHLFP